jgi:hypothetical protein
MGNTSLSPIEYDILFALIQLKQKGHSKASLKEICQEVNRWRKQEGIRSLSVQHVYYYLRKLSRRPFVKKQNEKHISFYSLVKGTFKLKQSPLLCLHIDDADFALICDKVPRCNKKPSIKCVEYLVNRGLLKLPPFA